MKANKDIIQLSLILLLLVASNQAIGQDYYERQKGEIGIGLNLIPVMNWLGNSFNGNVSNEYISADKFVSPIGGNTLYFKYFTEDNKAWRLYLGVNRSVQNTKNNLFQDGSTSDFVEDKESIRFTSFIIGAGQEFRINRGRLIGIYGYEAYSGVSNNFVKYTYGNEFSTSNPNPTSTTDFQSGIVSQVSSRTLKTDFGSSIFVGARVFAGIEYMLSSNIATGFEFGLSSRYLIDVDGEETIELVNEERTIPISNGGEFELGADNLNGSIFLFFYF